MGTRMLLMMLALAPRGLERVNKRSMRRTVRKRRFLGGHILSEEVASQVEVSHDIAPKDGTRSEDIQIQDSEGNISIYGDRNLET
jgi:hypothetical protein